MKELFIAIVFLLIGRFIGWNSAHITVAKECEVLGKFYVGDRVFHCTRITDVGPQS